MDVTALNKGDEQNVFEKNFGWKKKLLFSQIIVESNTLEQKLRWTKPFLLGSNV